MPTRAAFGETMSETSDLNAIYAALSQTRQSNYSWAAAVAFLAYDICLTFAHEVKYIWRERWSLVKVLYLFGRYYGLFNLILDAAGTVCGGMFTIEEGVTANVSTEGANKKFPIWDIFKEFLIPQSVLHRFA
ncbi:hypothetical protein B0H11DRAFT_1944803 [Mycena galericulata]|nr:hypothetical protein B0H11DRAFT_1944803 [Mycena galericulata]